MGSVLSQLQVLEIFLSTHCREAMVLEATNVPYLEEKLRSCRLVRFFCSAVGAKGCPQLLWAGDTFPASKCR